MMNCGGTVKVNRSNVAIVITCLLLLLFYYEYGMSSNIASPNSELSNQVDLRDLLSASIDAARRGGVQVYNVRESALLAEKSKGKTYEGANDPITDGDMQSHVEMFHSLQKVFPTVVIISEEKSSHDFSHKEVKAADLHVKDVEDLNVNSKFVNAKDVHIWIDPLDATQEYTEDLRQYVTTMVCVAVKGVPAIGVVHKPFENFTAWAYVDIANNPAMKVIKSNEGPPNDGSVRIIVSRSHKGSVVSVAHEAFGSHAIITDAGGAGYKTLEVLSGRQDIYVHKTLIKKWDICAGNALINHFGGKMTTLKGDNIDYSSPSDTKNPDGLIVTLKNHDYYLDRLRNLA